ncbi:hypothetical protein [Acinetobacter bereziniae]|uniref:hypothetical protein n=1 Tax=Acinetobacter bereziniae TaxID=106648 RepID=UPI0012506655|nr:hypothetical protein [Acinetobacter bereziniae]
MDLIALLPSFIEEAVSTVYKQDRDLMSLEGNEQAVVFRFAIYFNEIVKEHLPDGVVLDIEYNKSESDSKRIIVQKVDDKEAKDHGIRPDIILHQRKTSSYNLLVIECKRNSSEDTNDFNKLKAMTSAPIYQYKLGCFINFENNTHELTYFVDGKITENLAKVVV